MSRVHATALVDPKAELAADVEVGAYSIVGPDVRVGAGTIIGPHVVLTGRTSVGERNRLFQFTSIGEIPQDRKYGGEPTTTTIGDDNVFREFMTINAGTAQDRGDTRIGNANLFLAYTHVAHDCVVGNGTTFSNNAQLAGHVHVGDWVVMGAYSGVHQFCRVGAHAMIAAGAIVLQDVPPYVTAAAIRPRRAASTPRACAGAGSRPRTYSPVRRAYKTLYREGRALDDAKQALAEAAGASPSVAAFVEFLAVPRSRHYPGVTR
jgi:UDP-N-acetylglucosamine acyltransferase